MPHLHALVQVVAHLRIWAKRVENSGDYLAHPEAHGL